MMIIDKLLTKEVETFQSKKKTTIPQENFTNGGSLKPMNWTANWQDDSKTKIVVSGAVNVPSNWSLLENPITITQTSSNSHTFQLSVGVSVGTNPSTNFIQCPTLVICNVNSDNQFNTKRNLDHQIPPVNLTNEDKNIAHTVPPPTLACPTMISPCPPAGGPQFVPFTNLVISVTGIKTDELITIELENTEVSFATYTGSGDASSVSDFFVSTGTTTTRGTVTVRKKPGGNTIGSLILVSFIAAFAAGFSTYIATESLVKPLVSQSPALFAFVLAFILTCVIGFLLISYQNYKRK